MFTAPIPPKYCESYPVYQLSVSTADKLVKYELIRIHSQWTPTVVYKQHSCMYMYYYVIVLIIINIFDILF